MRIGGKEITGECSKCAGVLECELFRQGHGINTPRTNISEMFKCQLRHKESGYKNSCARQDEVNRII